ncbi:unnamed protein product [Effrenium voratum]|nr:unnamed protein product [Effrenium voratum]
MFFTDRTKRYDSRPAHGQEDLALLSEDAFDLRPERPMPDCGSALEAMRLLESMRASMPDVAALRGSFTLPTSAEDVVKTLCQVAPDAGRPPPEVVGAALKAAGLPATEENLQKALQEAFARTPSKEEKGDPAPATSGTMWL